MKILLSHRYFWPDSPPYAAMLRSIAESLAEEGHEVHVFASRPSYRAGVDAPRRERLGNLNIRRVWVFSEHKKNPATRALNVLIYSICLFFHIRRLRPDAVTAATFPPIISARMASIAAQLVGAHFIYHMQDIHPEVSIISGGILGRKPIANLLRALDKRTLYSATAIVVLSEDMADTLRQQRSCKDLPIRVINNFLLDNFEEVEPPPKELVKSAEKTRLIFAGNLGAFQNLSLLTEGLTKTFTNHPELELLFLGDGPALATLHQRWGNHPQIRFGPFLPFAQAKPLIADADIGLVSLIPEIYRVSYPSKVLTYLGLGIPVLALVESKSKLGIEIRSNSLGAVPPEPTAGAIADTVEQLLDTLKNSHDYGEAIVRYHKAQLSPAKAMSRWIGLLEEVQQQNLV